MPANADLAAFRSASQVPANTLGSGIRLFVGGDAGKIQGEPQMYHGDRCFTAWRRLQTRLDLNQTVGMLDSGAFSDSPKDRLTFEGALDRQLHWEKKACEFASCPYWCVDSLVSYDRLIDETWVNGEKLKQRWTVGMADSAVIETIEAARYLADRRADLFPRILVLSCQGVDSKQYKDCAKEILRLSIPGDWFGMGGWCILGRQRSLLPEFWRTCYKVLPMIKNKGLSNVHIFGVMWERPLGGLLWLCDRLGLRVSTDSTGPMMACTWKDWKKAGARRRYWRDNCDYWVNHLANLRTSDWYKEPPI